MNLENQEEVFMRTSPGKNRSPHRFSTISIYRATNIFGKNGNILGRNAYPRDVYADRVWAMWVKL